MIIEIEYSAKFERMYKKLSTAENCNLPELGYRIAK